jgi:hypothetical protein
MDQARHTATGTAMHAATGGTFAERPIGFWIKRLDRLIDDTFDHALGEAGLTRRQWQALSIMRSAAVTRTDLAAALQPFLVDGPESCDALVDALVMRGWVGCEADGSYALTAAGLAVREAASGHVAGIRAQLVDGLSERDYVETVRVLRAMGDNLERALPVQAGAVVR